MSSPSQLAALHMMPPQHHQQDPVAVGQQHHPSVLPLATAHAPPTEHMRAPKRSHSPARQDDARCVTSKATPAQSRPPPPAPPPPTRRPGHLSSKSASAVPTLSTLSIVAPPSAPTPPLSPTRSSRPTSRVWLGRPASSLSMATTHDGHLNPHTAEDLLRQAIMAKHG
ncbi:hypothetical protein LTS09_012160 [Friedmanniomyces endolithicus]|nr:hypothetical protein LTS09_012160 [Friedmanniomyces endolithicus]